MEEQALSCPICVRLYDVKDHEPHFIPFCGHSLCLKCLKNILNENVDSCKCPLCNTAFPHLATEIKAFPKNYAILDLVDTKIPREFCPVHRSQQELICLDCKCKICNKCVFNGVHKEHEVDLLENFNSDLEAKVKDINCTLVKKESYFLAIENLIGVKKDSLLSSIDAMHNNYVQLLTQKRDEIKKKVEEKFTSILQKGGVGIRRELLSSISSWNFTNNMESGFKLKEVSIHNIDKKINPDDSKYLMQEALSFQVKFENELNAKLQSLYELEEIKNDDPQQENQIEVEDQPQYGFFGDVLFEENDKNLFISMKNEDLNETPLDINRIKPASANVESCYIELESVNLTKENMNKILMILWSAKLLKSMEIKLKKTTFTKEAILALLASIAIHFKLQSLSIDFTESNGISDDILVAIAKALGTLEALKSLNLNFRSCLDITNLGLSKLASSICLLTEIETLNLNLDGCYVIASNGFDSFAKSLLNLKNMINLEVSCQKLSRLGDDGIISLSQAIMTLKKLNQFDLSFAFGSVGDKGMASLAANLRRLIGLRHLKLDFSNCDGISDYGITLLVQSLSSLSELHNLQLIFEGANSISDIGVLHLCTALQKLKKIHKLYLSFDHNAMITSHSLRELGKALIYLPNLSELNCLLGDCQNITDDGANNFAGSLASMTKLSVINLSFQSCSQITDHGVNKLSLALVDLTALKKFTFDIENCKEIGGKSIVQLIQCLATLPNMKQVSLFFKECPKIDDDFLEKVSFCLPLFSSLNIITIQFDGCAAITDIGVVRFMQACSVVHGLDSLNLSFMWCNQVTDDCLSQLAQSIQNILSLENLILDFRMCPKITNSGINGFFQQLPKSNKLSKKIFF